MSHRKINKYSNQLQSMTHDTANNDEETSLVLETKKSIMVDDKTDEKETKSNGNNDNLKAMNVDSDKNKNGINIAGKIQNNKMYKQIERMNMQPNALCVKMCRSCGKLPDCCEPYLYCMSIITSIIMYAAYIVGIVWIMLFPFYSFQYTSVDNSFTTTIILKTDDVYKVMYNKEFCQFYGIECFVDYTGNIDKSTWGQCYDSTGLQYKTSLTGAESRVCGCQCSNTCTTANNNICEDDTSCDYGTDCNDCGPRGNCTLCIENAIEMDFNQKAIDLNGIYFQIQFDERVWYKKGFDRNHYDMYIKNHQDMWYIDDNTNFSSENPIATLNAPNIVGNTYEWVTNIINDTSAMHLKNKFQITLSNCVANKSFVPEISGPNVEVTITELSMFNQFMITIQMLIEYCFWVYLKYKMTNINIMSILYGFLFIINNIMSYMFRHIGFIHYSPKDLIVLYSPYFTEAFIKSIPSYLICVFIWCVLAWVCLERVYHGKYERLKLRCRGIYDKETNQVDCKSVAGNIFVWLFVFYAFVVPSLWIGIQSIISNAIKIVSNDNPSQYKIDGIIGFLELVLTTIIKYFTPTIYWYMPFTIAALACNITTIIDITIFVMKIIKETAQKIKNMDDTKDNNYQKSKDDALSQF